VRAARTATKQTVSGTASFVTTASSLQSQSLLYLAHTKACQQLSPHTQLAIASGSLSLSKHKTHIPSLMLWPKAVEHVFAYSGSSGNAVSNTQLRAGRIPLCDRYCLQSYNNLAVRTLPYKH